MEIAQGINAGFAPIFDLFEHRLRLAVFILARYLESEATSLEAIRDSPG